MSLCGMPLRSSSATACAACSYVSNRRVTTMLMCVLLSFQGALLRDHVALVVERDAHLLAVLHRVAAPDALIVLLQVGHVLEPAILDPRARLPLGEAIRTRMGCARVVAGRGVNGVVRVAVAGPVPVVAVA